MEVSDTMRIILLGKSGAGKSSLVNTIFGEKLFKITHSLNSDTKECQAKTKSINGKNITLIDTPGFFDADRPEEELKAEIVKCIIECAPGPHAFLIVLKLETVTTQENQIIEQICKYFSEDALKYATVVFTHGDQLPEGMKIEEYISDNKHMSDLVKKCGGRCHVIDNKYWNNNPQSEYRNNQFQVEELLKTIDKPVLSNKGSYYTNETLKGVQEEIKQEEQNIRTSSGNMSEEEITQQARVNVFEKLLIKAAGIATGALLGALCGAATMFGLISFLQESSETVGLQQVVKQTVRAVREGAGRDRTFIVAATATGAVRGGIIGYYAAEGADTPGEAMMRAEEAVLNDATLVSVKMKDVMSKLSTVCLQNQNPQ